MDSESYNIIMWMCWFIYFIFLPTDPLCCEINPSNNFSNRYGLKGKSKSLLASLVCNLIKKRKWCLCKTAKKNCAALESQDEKAVKSNWWPRNSCDHPDGQNFMNLVPSIAKFYELGAKLLWNLDDTKILELLLNFCC